MSLKIKAKNKINRYLTSLKVQNKTNQYLINNDIPTTQILLVDDDIKEKFNITKQEALKKAEESGLDLICVSLKGELPVCKIADYKKLIYSQNKKKKKQKKETITKLKPKEMHFSFNTDVNDLDFKTKYVYKWLEQGIIVKIVLELTNKEKMQFELAQQKCQNIINLLKNKNPKIETEGKIHNEGRRLTFFLVRKKNKSDDQDKKNTSESQNE